MKITRREFVKTGAALAGLGAMAPELLMAQAEAAAKAKPTLVVLYLRGGADSLNTIIPYQDPLYYSIRPTINVSPRPKNGEPPAVIVNKQFAFHPSMRPLFPLYERGIMAPIINAGSTHPTRSHFDAQDFMERAAPGVKSITEGWLNRYLTATKTMDDRPLRAVSLQPTLPRSLRGEYPVLAVPHYGADHAMNVFESLYGCADEKEAIASTQAPPEGQAEQAAKPQAAAETMRQIMAAGSTGIKKLRRLNELLKQGGQSAAPYPNGHLARQFRDVAKLIKADEGLEVVALDYNGWDHHAYQGAVEGTFGNMLGELSQTLAAFIEDLGPFADKTVVLAMSEFGRTARENGNNGSDHGHGGYMMLVGGPVRGGRIYGKWTGLERDALNDGRDLPVHTDFRNVFAEVLHGMFGFDAQRANFFPDYQPREKAMGLLRV